MVRERYLSGWSAPRCADTFDVTVHAIRKRITNEGWSKRSLPDLPPILAAEPVMPAFEDARSAADWAVDETVRLMRLGPFHQASLAARLAEMLSRACGRLETGEPCAVEDDEALREALRQKVLALCAAGGSPDAR